MILEWWLRSFFVFILSEIAFNKLLGLAQIELNSFPLTVTPLVRISNSLFDNF